MAVAEAPATAVDVPAKPRSKAMEGLAQVWEVIRLAVGALVALVTPPFSWGAEFVEQGWSLARRAWFPLALSAFAFGYGAAGIQGAAFSEVLGSVERTGGVVGSVATIREIAVWVTGMLVAGVAGTAICADLGARKVRKELDALEVIGIDIVRRIVAPRVLALTLLMPALGMIAMVACVLGTLVAALLFGSTVAGFWEAFVAGLNPVDVVAYVFKTGVFGVVVAVVCCYKGINASGGSQGVGRAVNQAVVISFVAVWIINYAFNSSYQAIFTETQALR